MDAGEVELDQRARRARRDGSASGCASAATCIHSLRLDSVASIQNDGLVGNKFVQIDAGTEASPTGAGPGHHQSREPFDIADMMAKMSETIDTVTAMIVDVQGGRSTRSSTTLGDTAVTAQTLINDVGKDAEGDPVTTGNTVGADLQAIVAGVREGRGTVGKLLTDDALVSRARRRWPPTPRRRWRTCARRVRRRKRRWPTCRARAARSRGVTANLQQTLDLRARRHGGHGGDHRGAEAQLPGARVLQPARLLRPRRT